MRVAIASLAIVGLGAVVVGLALHGGWIDVAASQRHPKWVEAVLHYAMERSVHRRARGIATPEAVRNEDVEAGLVHYRAMCETCHGAPGEPLSEIAEGLYPRPPQFAEVAFDGSDAELFWITKHGIQMTGMPGFGATHGDDELWDIVAVVKRLPDMDPQRYRPAERMQPVPAPSDSHRDDHHRH